MNRCPHKTHMIRSVVLLACLTVLSTSTAHAQSAPARCGVGSPAGERGYVPLPRGDVFCPLVADPKAIRSFARYLRHALCDDDTYAVVLLSRASTVLGYMSMCRVQGYGCVA